MIPSLSRSLPRPFELRILIPWLLVNVAVLERLQALLRCSRRPAWNRLSFVSLQHCSWTMFGVSTVLVSNLRFDVLVLRSHSDRNGPLLSHFSCEWNSVFDFDLDSNQIHNESIFKPRRELSANFPGLCQLMVLLRARPPALLGQSYTT